MRTSIALATCNGARFLEEQLESIARQTVLPCELVVADDCSTDSTRAILDRFRDRAPFPVRLHLNAERLGCGVNFLKVAARCRGDLIAFCDQDDIWHPDKLAEVTSAFAAHPAAVLVCHYAALVDERAEPLGRSYPDVRAAGVYQRGTRLPVEFPGFAITARASVFEAIGPDWMPTLRPLARLVNHDVPVRRVAHLIGDVVVVPRELARYRQHGGNASFDKRRVGGHWARWRRMDAERLQRSLDVVANEARLLHVLANRWRQDDPTGADLAAERARALDATASLVRDRIVILAMPSRSRALAALVRHYGSNWATARVWPATRWSPWKDLAAVLAGTLRL